MREPQADLTLVRDMFDEPDDVDAHAVYCVCDDCQPDRRHDDQKAA